MATGAAIRPAETADFDAIAAITNHYIATTTVHFAYDPVSADELRGSWQRSLRHPWFVAIVDDRVAGYAKAAAWRERAAYAWTTEVGLYVAPEHHRRGLGAALYTALIDELDRRGFRSIVAGITLPNDASVAFHRAFGFESIGIVRDAGYKHGRWSDVEFLQRRLRTDDAAPRETQ